MIQPRSLVNIVDNSGAKIGRVFKVLGSSKKRWAKKVFQWILDMEK